MDQEPDYSLITTSSSSFLEIRLFYVRITPCHVDSAPDHLLLRHLRPETSASPLEINGTRIPSSDTASVTLRRDRLNKQSSEATYVSTDTVRITGAVEFEVVEEASDELILCGSMERLETAVSGVAPESDARTGWSMECYLGAKVTEGNSVILRPGIEVYVAGCCGGVPVILTKNIVVSPRKKGGSRHGIVLDAIPEDEEVLDKEQNVGSNGLDYRKLQISDLETDDYDLDGKLGNRYYSEDMYYGEDGQLSWFNAGVRVGVGIGLGMCIGIGVGVGLLMRSYQATTRNFRRRFF